MLPTGVVVPALGICLSTVSFPEVQVRPWAEISFEKIGHSPCVHHGCNRVFLADMSMSELNPHLGAVYSHHSSKLAVWISLNGEISKV